MTHFDRMVNRRRASDGPPGAGDEALSVVTRYFDEGQLAPKTRLALEELLGG